MFAVQEEEGQGLLLRVLGKRNTGLFADDKLGSAMKKGRDVTTASTAA